MSLEGRRTCTSLPLAHCAHRIPALIPRERATFIAHHTHTHIHIWMRASTKLRTFFPRERTTEERPSQIDHAGPALLTARVLSVPLYFLFFPFYLILPLTRKRYTVPQTIPRKWQRADANEVDSSRLGRGFERFLFANEGIVGSTL